MLPLQHLIVVTYIFMADANMTMALFRSDKPRKHKKKTSHRMFRHMHGVLNEVYLQNFLHG